jgi:cell wall-associated NlpC family hydrolase
LLSMTLKKRVGLAGVLFAASLIGAVPASAQTGGSGPPGSTTTTTTTDPTTTTAPSAPGGTAQLQPDGTALAPANAPTPVRKAIAAANKIHTRPYIWGGGHRSFKSRGYDCSGAVSYVLHAAGLLPSPLASGPLMSWGSPGVGSWITVYANRTHAWMTIAGLRYDTSSSGESLNQGSGPRWRTSMRAGTGYAARFYPGL